MTTALLISLYAAILATITFIWRIYEFYYDRKGRLKIVHEFYTNFLAGNEMFTTRCAFTIINIGPKKRIITGIGYQLNDPDDDGIYAPFQRFAGKPVQVEHGDFIRYDIDYADFNNQIAETMCTKLRLIVSDSTGKKIKTKWIRIKKFKKPLGHISEMPRKAEANVE